MINDPFAPGQLTLLKPVYIEMPDWTFQVTYTFEAHKPTLLEMLEPKRN